MDARSNLRNNINTMIARRLTLIAGLRDGLDAAISKANEYKEHHHASYLFYYCLMSVYGNLVACESLNQESKEDGLNKKYKLFEKAIVHHIGILWEVMENPNAIKREQNNGDSPLSEKKRVTTHRPVVHWLGQEYRRLLNQFVRELSGAQALTPELLLGHVQGINLAFIEMSFIFLDQSTPTSFLSKRLLSIASAFEFIFQVEYELRSYALKRAKVFVKGSTEFDFYEKMFSEAGSDKYHTCFSCQPLYDYLKKMIDMADESSFDDLFQQFKEFGKNYPAIPSEWHPKEKSKKGHYDHKASPARGGVDAVFLDGSQEAFTPERRMDADVASTPEALAANFGEKLKIKLEVLKNSYLGEGGEFSKIPAITQALLNEGQPLPVQETDRLYPYAERLQEELLPDLRIDHVLDSMTDTSPKVPARRSRASSKNTSSETSEVPATLTRTRSKSKPEVSSYSPVVVNPSNRLGSSQEHPKAAELDYPASQVQAPPPVTPPLHPETHTALVSPPRLPAKGAATVDYRKLSAARTPPFKPAIKMPSVAKYVLIGLGIGLLVTALAAAAVALTYFAIHGGAPLLAVAFITGTKLLGGSTIGAWSLVAGILACPPVVGVLGALHRWKRNCESLFSSTSTPTVKPSMGSRRLASEPVVHHDVKMISSERWSPQKSETRSLASNPSTLYGAKPAPVASVVAPEMQALVAHKKR